MLDQFNLRSLNDREEDLESMILRHQLDILERRQAQLNKPSEAEKQPLAILADNQSPENTDKTPQD